VEAEEEGGFGVGSWWVKFVDDDDGEEGHGKGTGTV